jgi:hypothetical protein
MSPQPTPPTADAATIALLAAAGISTEARIVTCGRAKPTGPCLATATNDKPHTDDVTRPIPQ